MKRLVIIIACMVTVTTTAAQRVGRPMIIHRVAELGLEIWTEEDPQWETHRKQVNGVTTFIADTPALTYPPAQMSWTSAPQIKFAEHDLKTGALGAIHQVATQHGLRAVERLIVEPRQYGELSGYESTFTTSSQQVPTEIRVFCGHRPGQPAVVMQVSTLKDKLDHLSEPIRRSWSNIRYLR